MGIPALGDGNCISVNSVSILQAYKEFNVDKDSREVEMDAQVNWKCFGKQKKIDRREFVFGTAPLPGLKVEDKVLGPAVQESLCDLKKKTHVDGMK